MLRGKDQTPGVKERRLHRRGPASCIGVSSTPYLAAAHIKAPSAQKNSFFCSWHCLPAFVSSCKKNAQKVDICSLRWAHAGRGIYCWVIMFFSFFFLAAVWWNCKVISKLHNCRQWRCYSWDTFFDYLLDFIDCYSGISMFCSYMDFMQ